MFLWITSVAQKPIAITLGNPTYSLSPLLFGQFLERAGKDEPGPEAAVQNGKLSADVVSILSAMNIPVVRFWGGGMLEWTDEHWFELVDEPGSLCFRRKKHNQFGYNEYFSLANELGWQSLIPVQFRRAVLMLSPLDEAATEAANLVSYCNGVATNDTLANKWVALRVKNGYTNPFGVKYFQIGNEWCSYFDLIAKHTPYKTPEEQAEWLVKCIKKFAVEMKNRDKTIKIITDGVAWTPYHRKLLTLCLSDTSLKKYVDMVTIHAYKPWKIDSITDGVNKNYKTISNDKKWLAGVAVPNINSDGYSTFDDSMFVVARKYGWRLAMTEWNWNGFSHKDSTTANLYLKGIGAAGFLHAILRHAENMELATQSMLVGAKWELNAIRVANNKADAKAILYPTGAITSFFASHVGDTFVPVMVHNNEFYNQTLKVGQITPADKVAYLDVVATQKNNRVFLSVINRHPQKGYNLDVILPKYSKPLLKHTFELKNTQDYQTNTVKINPKQKLAVSPKSVTVFEFLMNGRGF